MQTVVKNMVGNWTAADDKGRRNGLCIPLKKEIIMC